MGQVFRARDLSLHQDVALKLLPQRMAHDPAALRQLRDEVRVARRVSHPNVCRVHDIGQDERGEPFLTMELVDGESLAAVLRRIGRLPAEKALEIGRQIAAGLAAAHAEGIVHRDLKPANVLLDADGRARIADFGLATALATPGEIAGTPAYMAPEQLAGAGATVRSDVYSLGLVLYELFTGKRAIEGRSLEELRKKHDSASPVTPSDLVREMDPRVERVILRCLEKDPARRPASALEVLTELSGGDALQAALAAGQTPSAHAVATSGATGALKPRTALALLIGFLGSLVVGWALDRSLPNGIRLTLVDVVGLPHPPEVLAYRAREGLATLGLQPRQREVTGFHHSDDVIRWLETPSPARREALSAGRASAVRFAWMSGVPRPDERNARLAPPLQDRPDLPPGAVSLRLDTRGRLLRLVAAPDSSAPPRAPEETVAALLALAGLDPRLLSPVELVGTPPVFADRRVAFEGPAPDAPSLRLHAEAATFHGVASYFEVWGPWGPPRAAASTSRFSVADFELVCEALALIAAAFLVRRNLAAGRADRSGALRLFFFVFTADLVVGLLRARHVAGGAEVRLVTNLASSALWSALTAWLFYVALEPHVRRQWPHCLVSWTRLLAGRFHDPAVARDLLVGLFFYQAIACVTLLIIFPLRAASGGPLPVRVSLTPLSGTRYVAAALLDGPRNGVTLALLYLLVLLLVRVVVRKVRLASLLFFGIFFVLILAPLTLISGPPGFTALGLAAFLAAAWTVMLTRVGFLSMAVIAWMMDLAVSIPFTFDFARWYAGGSLATLSLLFALAIWGFWYARAPRSVALA